MRKHMTVYDGWAMAFLVIVAMHPDKFPWWIVCLPWVVECVVECVNLYLKYTGAKARIMVWLARRVIRLKAWFIKRQIRKETNKNAL